LGLRYRFCAGAVVVLLPVDPVADGVLAEPDPVVVDRLPEPVVERVVVLTPTRARTPLVVTRLRLTPLPITTPRRRCSMMVVRLDGTVA
jgi:hypothetical protein